MLGGRAAGWEVRFSMGNFKNRSAAIRSGSHLVPPTIGAHRSGAARRLPCNDCVPCSDHARRLPCNEQAHHGQVQPAPATLQLPCNDHLHYVPCSDYPRRLPCSYPATTAYNTYPVATTHDGYPAATTHTTSPSFSHTLGDLCTHMQVCGCWVAGRRVGRCDLVWGILKISPRPYEVGPT